MAILSFQNVSKSFIDGSLTINILNNFTFDFPSNGLVTIEGLSGVGKSTILKLISGFEKCDKGNIFINTINISKSKTKELLKIHRDVISSIFQTYPTIKGLSVLDNLLLPLLIKEENKSRNELKTMAINCIDKYAPDIHVNQKCNELSGGQAQRVCIIRTILCDPQVILADEPTGSLDNDNAKVVMNLLKEVSKNKLVIVVTHNHELVNQYSDFKYGLWGGALHALS